jgi:hypothetical protein
MTTRTARRIEPDRPSSSGARYQRLFAQHLGEMNPAVERRVSELLALTDFTAAAFERLNAAEVASLIVLVALGETG